MEIAHWSGRRYLRSLLPVDPSRAAQGDLPLKPRGVYLVTGGAGKLGLVLASYLATRYQARLVLKRDFRIDHITLQPEWLRKDSPERAIAVELCAGWMALLAPEPS